MFRQFCFLFILFFSITGRTQGKTCVLSFYKKNDPIEISRILKVFPPNDDTASLHRGSATLDPNITLFREAQYSDLEYCFTSGQFVEILFLAHGTIPIPGLSYFTAPRLYLPPNSTPSYLPILSFNNIIHKIEHEGTTVQRFRISSCLIDFEPSNNSQNKQIKSSVDVLTRYLLSRAITVDISPKFDFASKLLQHEVTTVDIEWLARNIDRQRLRTWATDRNPYCETDRWTGCDRVKAHWTIPLTPMLN